MPAPMKLIEYMAAGKAIVAPDQPNIRELLEHKKNALLFSPGDWSDFACQVELLVLDPSLRNALGRAARDTVLERQLTWENNARHVLSLFSKE